MKLPFLEGREIVPVRLIPLLSGFEVGPTALTRLLAHQVSLAFPLSRPEDELSAYHLLPQGVSARMLPKEWDVFVSDMEILERTSRRQEEFEDEGYTRWRTEAVKLLPAGVFVWKEELEAVYRAWRNLEALHAERPGSRELNFAPYIKPQYRDLIWEGFASLLSDGSTAALPSKRRAQEKVAMIQPEILLGYADFIRLCRIDNPGEWGHGYRVDQNGVWIVPPAENILYLGSSERAALSEHPDKDLSKPALAFPCSLEQLQTFLEWAGLYGCIDPFDMAEFVRKEVEKGKATGIISHNEPAKKANPKEINTLLKLVISMAIKGYAFDPNKKKSSSPSEIAVDVQQLGLSIDVDTVRKWLHKGTELLPSCWNDKD